MALMRKVSCFHSVQLYITETPTILTISNIYCMHRQFKAWNWGEPWPPTENYVFRNLGEGCMALLVLIFFHVFSINFKPFLSLKIAKILQLLELNSQTPLKFTLWPYSTTIHVGPPAYQV